jgi:hypothetical protein
MLLITFNNRQAQKQILMSQETDNTQNLCDIQYKQKDYDCCYNHSTLKSTSFIQTKWLSTLLLLFICVLCYHLSIHCLREWTWEKRRPSTVCSEFLPLVSGNYKCHKHSQHQEVLKVQNMYNLMTIRYTLFSQLMNFLLPKVLQEKNC